MCELSVQKGSDADGTSCLIDDLPGSFFELQSYLRKGDNVGVGSY